MLALKPCQFKQDGLFFRAMLPRPVADKVTLNNALLDSVQKAILGLLDLF
ncbi:MAG: hypothetical protein P4M15_11590 [Alphaproteobacteria bacterium]|nr:hypothetical protein [Alphaproteobacteria bacterium]